MLQYPLTSKSGDTVLVGPNNSGKTSATAIFRCFLGSRDFRIHDFSVSRVTTLEVGGAYAHRFEGLLSFLSIPYLVITDLDSVAPQGYPSACRADTVGARTSNATLKKLCGKNTITELIALSSQDKQQSAKDRCIVFQIDIPIVESGVTSEFRPRTLEEAIAYQNFALLRSGTMSIGVDIPQDLSAAYSAVYERMRSDDFKKTEFAMDLLAIQDDWTVPNYISDGLQWLERRLCPISAPTVA